MSNHTCAVKSVNDLIACQQCAQNQICCSICFKLRHVNQNKSIHASSKLVDSDVYKNFLKIVYLQWLVGNKLLKSLGDFNFADQNTKTYLANGAWYGSQFFRQLFKQQKSQQQYYLMKNLYSGINESSFENLSAIQKILNDAKTLDVIGKYVKKLTQLSQQQKIMSSHIDFYTGADIFYLREFFVFEQQLFFEHSKQIQAKQEQDQWTIYKYIQWRQKTCDKQKNPIYYSKQYTAFLVQFYRKNAQQKGNYSLNDYMQNYWQYFNTTIQLNPTIKSYFDQQVKFYRIYENLMTQNNLFITHLGFKIWKLSNGVSKQLPYLKNHYFLFAFIQGYIKMLIQRTYTFLKAQEKEQYAKQSWTDFVTFIKDYSILIQEQKEKKQFLMDNYKNYYLYRKRLQPFHDKIKSSKQNIYDKQIATRFFNHYFLNPTQLKPKLYKQFFQKQQQLKKQRQDQQNKLSQQLKEQLKEQQKQSFYEFVFLNFISYCKEYEISIKKETYYIFKKNVLDSMDEKYIQQTEERFKRGDFNTNQNQAQQNPDERQETQEQQTVIGETGAKITIGMDQFEQEILQSKLHQDQQSEGEVEQFCLCCRGNSYQCQNPDCQLMGYCVNCGQQ